MGRYAPLTSDLGILSYPPERRFLQKAEAVANQYDNPPQGIRGQDAHKTRLLAGSDFCCARPISSQGVRLYEDLSVMTAFDESATANLLLAPIELGAELCQMPILFTRTTCCTA
jgi:hypothetical protein